MFGINFTLSPMHRALRAAGVALPTGPIRIATYGDSRATLFSGAVSGDMYNGVKRNVRDSLTNHSTAYLTLPIFMNDVVLTADITAQYAMQPLKMTGDSSLIGAPAGGSGLRMYLQCYFGITPTPFRVRWTAPEFKKVV